MIWTLLLTSLPIAITLLSGCDGPQSTLTPAGRGAEQISTLFWWMTACGFVIWCVYIGLAIYTIRIVPQPHDTWRTGKWIIGGGVVLPTVLLTALLIYGLSMLPGLVRPAPEGSLHIEVTGIQWWWRVRYPVDDSESVELANEIRLPVGEPVQFDLQSEDVIHSFWIPALGGKMDMIPGRETLLTLEPTKTGTFRGVCAEYCGASHALMAFDVIVTSREEFDEWLEQQSADATEPTDQLARDGRQVFFRQGCGACHAIRGTEANGVIGPDLTHVGSRASLAAGTLPNDPEAFRRWLEHTSMTKPSVNMPDFNILSERELTSLAAYLEGLK
ncbi:MAG: cytochrome c oxidase subunit II [Planctomycetaceae bacterium]|nr:cytochrome c oxidase subunit II [Planctomycetaceae bacterium]